MSDKLCGIRIINNKYYYKLHIQSIEWRIIIKYIIIIQKDILINDKRWKELSFVNKNVNDDYKFLVLQNILHRINNF